MGWGLPANPAAPSPSAPSASDTRGHHEKTVQCDHHGETARWPRGVRVGVLSSSPGPALSGPRTRMPTGDPLNPRHPSTPAGPCLCVVSRVHGVCVSLCLFSQMKCNPDPDESPESVGRSVPGYSLRVSGMTPLQIPWACWVRRQPLPGSAGAPPDTGAPFSLHPGPRALVCPSWVQGGCRARQEPRRPGLGLERPALGPAPGSRGPEPDLSHPLFSPFPGTPGS